MKAFVLSVIIIFVALCAVLYALKQSVPDYRFEALMAGNIIMASLSLLSFFMVSKSFSKNPSAFVRGVYGGSFLKLMVCMITIMAYMLFGKSPVHKPTIMMLLGIYAVYTVAETLTLSKLARKTNKNM